MKKFSLSLLTLLSTFGLAHADVAPKKPEPKFHEYHNRIAVFSTNHLTYERTRTDALYVGVETWLVPSTGHNRWLFEAEYRMGYNYFWNGRDHFIPLAGVGFLESLKDRHHHHNRHFRDKLGAVYFTTGFLYDHEFNTIFNLGLNVKGLIGGRVSGSHHWKSPVYGIDVALPITFRFGGNRHWDIRIEPFNIYLHVTKGSQNNFGSRSTVGYRF